MAGLVLQLAGEPPKQQVFAPDASNAGRCWDQMDPETSCSDRLSVPCLRCSGRGPGPAAPSGTDSGKPD